MNRSRSRLVLFASLACSSLACSAGSDMDTAAASTAQAAQESEGAAARAPRPPPAAAVAACADLAVDAPCTFSLDGDELTGTCRGGPSADLPLACAPLGPPPGEPQGPPAEAIAACADLAADTACTFALDDNALTGTCRAGPNGEQPLACVPAFGPGPNGRPRGGPTGAPPPSPTH